jgi:hypothetical protein
MFRCGDHRGWNVYQSRTGDEFRGVIGWVSHSTCPPFASAGWSLSFIDVAALRAGARGIGMVPAEAPSRRDRRPV